MAERTRRDDLNELMDVVRHAISCALADGDGKHAPGSWLDEPSEHHLDHMIEHASQYYSGRDFQDIANMICRGGMHLRRRELEGKRNG